MKYLILIGILLLVPLVGAIEISETPIITIIYDTQVSNIETGDDNIYDVFCDLPNSNTCHVYRTNSLHTTLTGD